MNTIPVLMYHRVCRDDERVHSRYVVNVDVFRRQVQYFHQAGYCTPTLGDILASKDLDIPKGKKPLIITFDDGYLDTYEIALPVLREFGFNAVVFIVADFSRRTNWWDSQKQISEAQLMEPSHMREMIARGIEFGSHGVSHRSLPLLSDDELEFELHKSKQISEEVLGQPVHFFAYPYGELDERVKLATIRSGYRCAFASNSGPLNFHADPFEIRRVLIANHASVPYLYAKLSGFEKALKWGEWIGKKFIGKQPAYTL